VTHPVERLQRAEYKAAVIRIVVKKNKELKRWHK
jgi:hypothetical protein